MASSDPRIAIARRDLASLSREKTIVLALLIQLFVAAFSSFLVVGLTSLYDPGSVSSNEVTIGITGDGGDDLVAAAEREDVQGAELQRFPTREAASQAFQSGRVDAILIADQRPGGPIRVNATAPDGSLRTTLVVVQLQQLLEAFERHERIQRQEYIEPALVPLPEDVDASPYFGFTYTILLPLLLFLPPFISGSVAVDAITEEIERGTLELLRVAPVSLLDIVDGKAAAMAILAPAQALLWIALLSVNGIGVANVPLLLVMVAAVSTIVVLIGVLLGLYLGERRSAQLIYSLGVLALFAAGVLLPEHPATTVAKLAVDSPVTLTYALVGGYAVVAIGLAAAARAFVRRVDPESL